MGWVYHRFAAWLPGLFLIALVTLQPWLEATMARHMGIEFPALFMIGWLAAFIAGPRLTLLLQPYNIRGFTALVFALLVTAFWMLPVALDLAVLHPIMGVVKVLSWLLAGLLVGASWKSMGLVIQAFFVFNWVWMTFAVGLIYQEAPQQLCSVYLEDQQWDAGASMVFWAAVVLILWLKNAYINSNQK